VLGPIMLGPTARGCATFVALVCKEFISTHTFYVGAPRVKFGPCPRWSTWIQVPPRIAALGGVQPQPPGTKCQILTEGVENRSNLRVPE